MNNNNHGGKRKNAGRKFECERVRLSTCVSPGTHKRLKALAMSQGLTMSKVIPRILEAYIRNYNIDISDYLDKV